MAGASKESAFYTGRLATDGNGNLLADEGDQQGMPVAYHEGNFVYLQPGEPSHNERYHQQFAGVTATQSEEPTMPGFAGEQDSPTEGNEHHWGAVPDDPHYAEGEGQWNTRVKNDPDAVAVKITGHTDAYRDSGGE